MKIHSSKLVTYKTSTGSFSKTKRLEVSQKEGDFEQTQHLSTRLDVQLISENNFLVHVGLFAPEKANFSEINSGKQFLAIFLKELTAEG